MQKCALVLKSTGILLLVLMLGSCSRASKSAAPPDAAAIPVTVQQLPGSSKITLSALPTEGWRTFAKPLAIGREELLLFQRDGGSASIWRVSWKDGMAQRTPLLELPLEDKKRYSVIATSQGLWFVGDVVLLIKPDGRKLTRSLGLNEPQLVALADGSVLAFEDGSLRLYDAGNGKAERRFVQFVAGDAELKLQDRGVLSYDGQANETGKTYRAPRYGETAITLADGGVLMLGGDVTGTLASIIEPATWRVKPVAAMPHARSNAAVARLPDGRVVVGGAESLRCYEASARVVDVYDPKTDRWSSLPDLPLPLCSDAYGADRPSITLGPDGTLVLGGHLEKEVMTLAPDAKSPNGYASSWRLVPGLPMARVSGIVQVLGNGDVAVAGGVHNPRGFGGCCKATPGLDRLNPKAPLKPYGVIGLGMNAPAVALNGKRLFVAAGRRFMTTGSGQMRYSSLAELMDLETGQVAQLESVPFASGAGDAVWLDDDRVLVKGHVATDDRGFSPDQSLSSYVPESSGALAVYSISKRQWKTIDAVDLKDTHLVGRRAGKLLFADDQGKFFLMRGDTFQVEALPTAIRARRNAAVRWLEDGRILRAGGTAQRELVSVEDDCDDQAEGAPPCRERYSGYGELAPANDFETLKPNAKGEFTDAEWTLSNPAPTRGETAAVDPLGQVFQLGWSNTEDSSAAAVLEVNEGIGGPWSELTPPLPGDENDGTRCSISETINCRLMLAVDPRDPAKQLLFLRQGYLAHDGMQSGEVKTRVLWLNPGTHTWQVVIETQDAGPRDQVINLPAPLSDPQTQMRSLGWHLQSPILWLAAVH